MEGVRFSGLRSTTLLVAVNKVVAASLSGAFQLPLRPLVPKYDASEMRISAIKSEAVVLSWKRLDCPLHGFSVSN